MDKVQKILTYAIGLIAVVSAYLWYSLSSLENPAASDVDAFYTLTIIILSITVGVTIIASLLQLFSDMKQLKQALVVLVIVGIVVFASYSLAGDEVVTFLGQALSTAEESKWVGTGLYATYIAGAGAILSIVLSPVIKLIK